MNDNQAFSSFMMLNEHLYEVFAQYILDGRTRAPPETELIEMLPTFQFGAKTDRRALQSKFKSWAKRMNFENGCLMLANAGKIIIPKEKCEDVIMHFHSAEHHDIEKVIAQIRMTYSWTRKNFGMDRDLVVNSIMRNCKKEDCLKRMRMEIARLSNSLCSSVLHSQVSELPEMPFGMPPPLPCVPSYPYPVAFHLPPIFPSSGFPFQIPFFNSMYAMGNPPTMCSETMGVSLIDRKAIANSEKVSNTKVKTKEETSISSGRTSASNLNAARKASVMKFKKPKNVYEYKSLIEAVRHRPKQFPKILGNEKTQFLSNLGIAPKSICSSRTLKKFRKELRSKQFMNRECMIYRERKMLRDRNKLKKCLDQKKRHFYLGMAIHKDSSSTLSEKISNRIATSKQSQFIKTSSKFNREQKNACSRRKRVKISHNERKKPIEVITIASSDEDTPQEVVLPPKESTQEKEANEISSTQSQSEIISKKLISETTTEEPANASIDTKNSDESDKQDDSLKNEIADKNNLAEATQRKLSLIQKIHNRILNRKRFLLPKNLNKSVLDQLSNNSNTSLGEKPFPVPQLAASCTGHPNTMIKHSTNYLLSHARPTPVAIRQATPSIVQSRTSFAVSNQTNISKIVYPIPVSKTPTSSRFFLVDKEHKGQFYFIPPHNKPVFPQNLPRAQLQVTLDANALKPPMSMQSFAPQLQIRPKNIERESILYGKLFKKEDKTEVDINEEMKRITAWIYRMKANLNPSMFTQGIEKSVQKLLSQLDIGIYLVRKAKKSLMEIENFVDIPKPSTKVAE